MNRKPIILGLLVVALLLTAGALWCMEKRQRELVVQPVADPVQVETESTIDTADWKTYRNEEYGFEVKYPKDWSNPKDPRLVGGVRTIFLSQGNYSEGCCSGLRIQLRPNSMEEVYSQLVLDYPKEDVLSDTEQDVPVIKTRHLLFLTHYGDKNERVFVVPFSKNRTAVFRYGDGDLISENVFNSLSIFNDK